MLYRKTPGDRIFDAVVIFLAVVLLPVTLYPLIYTISMTISNPRAAAAGEVWLLPKGLSFDALKTVLNDDRIGLYYYNTLWYTVVGTVSSVLVTCLGAYPLSRPEFTHRSIFMKIYSFTMFFGGGLIPSYILIVNELGLYNSRLAIILPGLTSAWNLILTRNYFQSLPENIVESARLDGASEFRIFGQLIVPLSKPIIGVLSLYSAVGQWNSWFPHMLYLGDQKKHPLALYVRSVVLQTQLGTMNNAVTGVLNPESLLSALQVKYAVIVVSIVPMLCLYPMLSKNLEKGLLLGAVKG